MTIPEQIRDLQTVAAAVAWFRQHGMSLNSAEHVAFISRMQALLKHESQPGPPHGDGLAAT